MRRVVTLVAMTAALALVLPIGAMANETHPSTGQLENAGWDCFDPDGGGPLGDHCTTPGTGHGPVSNVLVFDAGTGYFAGTELLDHRVNRDLSDRPCPGGHEGTWELVGPPTDPMFWACHHWKGGGE